MPKLAELRHKILLLNGLSGDAVTAVLILSAPSAAASRLVGIPQPRLARCHEDVWVPGAVVVRRPDPAGRRDAVAGSVIPGRADTETRRR